MGGCNIQQPLVASGQPASDPKGQAHGAKFGPCPQRFQVQRNHHLQRRHHHNQGGNSTPIELQYDSNALSGTGSGRGQPDNGKCLGSTWAFFLRFFDFWRMLPFSSFLVLVEFLSGFLLQQGVGAPQIQNHNHRFPAHQMSGGNSMMAILTGPSVC